MDTLQKIIITVDKLYLFHGLKKVLVFLLFHRMQDIDLIKSCALERTAFFFFFFFFFLP